MWTQFFDMHSGGGTKEKWEEIYIEAPEEEARRIFMNRFGHDPDDVACPCCGPNYSISESETLAQSTGYHRNCDSNSEGYIEAPKKYYSSDRYYTLIPLEEYIKENHVLVIPINMIAPEERL